MKQQQATWAPDDFKPRKGPHRLARSSTRRRLFVEVPECLAVTAYDGVRLSVSYPANEGRGGWVIEGGGMAVTSDDVTARIYGPTGLVWGEVQAWAPDNILRQWQLRCPSLDGRLGAAPALASALLEAAGFRAVRRPLADLARAEQALSR